MVRVKKTFQRRSLRKKLFKFGFLVIIFLIVLNIYLLITSDLLKIKNVEFRNKSICIDEKEFKNSLNLSNQFLLFINKKSIETKIKEKYPCLKSASIHLYPMKISIDVQDRDAILNLIATPSSFLVDDNGTIFSEGSQNNLPRLFISGENIKLGESIGDYSKKTAEVFNKIQSLGITIEDASLNEAGILEIQTKPKILVNIKNDFENKLASLQLITVQAKIEGKELELIDLRFKNPVVKYISGKN
ncbi:MAG: Uncharacterized protein G01um101493_146 [Microgenomates group bacterium Gr01-1014_93]|nr:MAG: Uncharacterized protein G01um101493_146 [Microgenomates group bacterium Gr01-1014_93]